MTLFTPLKRKFAIGLLAVLFVLSKAAAQQCPTLIWSDEFDQSSLDLSSWQYDIGNGAGGWGNNEQQYYTSRPDNIKLQDGKLIITAKAENYAGFDYTSAKITSAGKRYFTYGRMEAKIKLPKTQGLWPAFWMMPQASVYGGWPASGEIDIMEVRGSDTYSTHGTVHFGPNYEGRTNRGGSYSGVDDLADDFHIYAVEWKQDTISWYIDDVNFYTITKTAISPYNWPFDKDFFLIFNLAVGGWFGGNPNGTTVFPQTMEIDYVRVYSNPNTLHINGTAKAIAGQTYEYSATNGNADSYVWTVPAGATIIDGQNTSTIHVQWGTTGGDVKVDVVRGTCGAESYYKQVNVIPNGCDVIFDDFESNRLMTYGVTSTGVGYNAPTSNPSPDAVNSSPSIASYSRNSFEVYDVLKYNVNFLPTSVEYENGRSVLYMDVNTSAPVGTQILWQFENKAKVSLAYPSGRRAVFRAVTTVQNQWERLKFTLQSRPDLSTAPTSIDQFTILFAPNTSTNHVYHIDRLMRRDVFNCGLATGVEDALEQNFVVSPNPAHDLLNVSLSALPAGELQVVMVDVLGIERLTKNYTVSSSSSQQESIDLTGLKPGMYILYAKQENQTVVSRKIIVQ